MSKQERQKKHARRRFWQRYGIRLTCDLRRRIIRDIQLGRADVIENQSHRVSVFGVEIQGEIIPVVYDKSRHEIVTALPQEVSVQ